MRTASTRFLPGLPGYIFSKNGRRKRVLSPNSRAHWRTQAAVKKFDRQRTADACRKHGLDGLRLTKAEVRVVLHFRTRHARDLDNAQALLKGVLDGLVDAGVIIDDSAAVIGQPLIEFRTGAGMEGFEVEVRYEEQA